MFFVAYLLGFTFASALATIPVVVTSNQPACPGELVAVQCTVGGDVLSWSTPVGAFNLLGGRHEEGDAGSFHWTLLELDASTLQSTLTFSATTEFAIECSNSTESSSVSVQVEGPPSAPDRPLTALDRIERINKTFSSVSVVWDIPETNNNYISRYVVTVDPPIFMPANGVIEAANPQFQARKITLVLIHEQRYSVRVRADNCNNTQQGMNSSALTINIQEKIETTVSAIVKQDVSDGSSSISRSVVIYWSISSKQNITQYTVTVRPPASPCGGGGGQCVVGEGDSGFSSRELSLQLELGVAYEVTVSTVNCGTQAGRESDPVTILLQLPDVPTCEAVPHYRDNRLFMIEVTWPSDKQPSGLRNTVSEVEYYTVMFDPAIISFPALTPNTSCHNDECYFNFRFTSVPHSFTNDNATFSLLITATSAVGESSPALCSLHPIGVRNHVKVDSITGPHVSVVVRFPQNHTRKRCNLTFGYNDTLQSLALSSREDGSEIEYALHSVVAGQTYAYNLECSVDIKVDGDVSEMKFTDQGNFEAGCFLRDLILAEESILFLNHLCLELPNGLVCHSGHLPGSSAVYMCREHHSLQHGDSSRVCEESGEWSGEVPVCLPLSLTDYNTTDTTTTVTVQDSSGGPRGSAEANVNVLLLASVSSIAGILICIISCLIGAQLHRTLSKYSCNCNIKSKKKPALPRHYYDEITLNTPTVTAPELLAPTSDTGTSTFHVTSGDNEIETTPNAAYMQVNRM